LPRIESVISEQPQRHPQGRGNAQIEDAIEAILSVDGRPDQALKPGEWFEVPAEVPHSVQIVGDKPGRALGHYVIEKDKPLVT
jgi:mannose-6-phosphate isomerase-like protein (cupin superfamily)